jgi:hypothetical protein
MWGLAVDVSGGTVRWLWLIVGVGDEQSRTLLVQFLPVLQLRVPLLVGVSQVEEGDGED